MPSCPGGCDQLSRSLCRGVSGAFKAEATSRYPLASARSEALRPSASTASRFAEPKDARYSAASRWPAAAARCSGVEDSPSVGLAGSAPASNSSLQTEVHPTDAAMCSGVRPPLQRRSTSRWEAPGAFSKALHRSGTSSLAAKCKGVKPHSSDCLGSAPWRKRRCRVSTLPCLAAQKSGVRPLLSFAKFSSGQCLRMSWQTSVAPQPAA
mmetsp:Transcript_63151/g.137293  ORF Transcript_63151/g.137293 Transcript_63151/m.137293 type:complete len:209 (+) Transcript_63151:556-1182(+)